MFFALIKVIHKVTLSFTSYPLFQWYPQSKEILLNLIMKCWNSAFNAQGSRVIIVIVQVVGAVKIYVAAVEARAQEEGRKEGRNERDETQFCTKIGGKKTSVWVSVISFFFVGKISFPVMHLMPYYAETGRSSRHPLIAWLYR